MSESVENYNNKNNVISINVRTKFEHFVWTFINLISGTVKNSCKSVFSLKLTCQWLFNGVIMATKFLLMASRRHLCTPKFCRTVALKQKGVQTIVLPSGDLYASDFCMRRIVQPGYFFVAFLNYNSAWKRYITWRMLKAV